MLLFFHLYLVFFHRTFDNFYELCDFSSYTLQIRWCVSTSIVCCFLCRALFFLLLFDFAFFLCYFIVLIVIYKRLYFLVVNLITTSLLFAQAFQINIIVLINLRALQTWIFSVEHYSLDRQPSQCCRNDHYSIVIQRSLQHRPSLDIIAPGYFIVIRLSLSGVLEQVLCLDRAIYTTYTEL